MYFYIIISSINQISDKATVVLKRHYNNVKFIVISLCDEMTIN